MMDYLNASSMVLELGFAAALFCLRLPRKNRFWARLAGFFGGSLALVAAGVFLMHQTVRSPQVSMPQLYLYGLLVFGWAVCLLRFCCAVGWSQAVYYATCAYLLQHAVYCFSCLVVPGGDAGRTHALHPWLALVYLAAYLAAYRFWVRRMTENRAEPVTTPYTLGVMVCGLSVTLLLSVVVQRFQQEGGPLYAVCLLYAMFCCCFIIGMETARHMQAMAQHERDVQQQLWQQQKAQYEMSAANVELINRKCHDLKHQIAALKQIHSPEQRDASIRELERSVMIYDAIVKTGNEILDTVLTEKSLLCDARGITLTCMADGHCVDFMDGVDVYTIFGNILDNAIECVSQLAPEERIITVTVFSRGGLTFFQVENYYRGALQMEGGLPVTQKGDTAYHGFGLKSIRCTAEKYGGFLTLQTEGGIFLLRVTIPPAGGR